MPYTPPASSSSGGLVYEYQSTDNSGNVTFANPQADVYYATCLGAEGGVTVVIATLPEPLGGSPGRLARIVADSGLSNLSIQSITVTNGGAGTNSTTGNSPICVSDLVWSATEGWTFAEYDPVFLAVGANSGTGGTGTPVHATLGVVDETSP